MVPSILEMGDGCKFCNRFDPQDCACAGTKENQELFEAKANLVRAQRDEAVTTFKLLSVAGGMTAANLNLPVEIYDPGQHYYMVKEKWIGFDEDNEGGSFFDMDFGNFLNKSSFLDFIH